MRFFSLFIKTKLELIFVFPRIRRRKVRFDKIRDVVKRCEYFKKYLLGEFIERIEQRRVYFYARWICKMVKIYQDFSFSFTKLLFFAYN